MLRLFSNLGFVCTTVLCRDVIADHHCHLLMSMVFISYERPHSLPMPISIKNYLWRYEVFSYVFLEIWRRMPCERTKRDIFVA
jgi:hypothetical protein